jgi:hypothetical protein
MNKKISLIYVLILIIPIAGIVLQQFYLKPAIIDAYMGQADSFLQSILDLFYPRFEVEKNRFNLNFFLQKSDQVIYRFTLIYYLTVSFFYFFNRYESFRNKIKEKQYTITTTQNVDFLRILFFSYLVYLSFELCHDLIVLQSVKTFYRPILWLRLFNIPFPGFTTIIIMGSIWTFLNILILVNIRPVISSILSLMLFLLIQSYTLSFEKIDHGYVTITYAFILIPFLLNEQSKNPDPFNSWSLQLIRFVLAMIYFLSALEKIFISKLAWLNPSTLQGYLSLHETYWSKIIIQYDGLCILISAMTILLQLSFILIVFYPRYKWIWILGGMVFHYGTLLVMNIGHPLNPWIVTYVFFIDWTRTYKLLTGVFKKINFS